jgi:quercetin dioxygenase-like cupin family protein
MPSREILDTFNKKEAAMKRTLLVLGFTLAVGIVVGVMGSRVLDAQQEPLRRSVLLQTDLKGMEGKEARLIINEFAPGAAVGKHYHPGGHELFYILEGSGTLEVEGSAPLTVKQGDTAYQPPGQVHAFRNASTTDPIKALVCLISEKDQPLVVPVK